MKQENKEEGSRTWYVIGWVLLIAALVALGLMLGPCDPAPEPVPAAQAQDQYNSSGLPEVDLAQLPPLPGESTGCEVTGFQETSSGETTGK